ncbi:MAG: tRNA (adenosine(37)-N6)-threonylcarbamoyltransferase complex dimerization subunit type 1 TsaB [bacterium]|nr:tRNA (adenosine(37)-N6)-threonylcarbamoyltransferase complex dimerization subunit type 1 TsaB [bacterium]
MKVLGIETSSLVASVALVTDEVLTGEYTVNLKKTHSQTLLTMVDELLSMLGMEPQEVDAIAVSAGPGSFTGLRIGSATAKGLGLALKKPLISVPTVDAMAYNIYGSSALICPIMDAKRNQVYTGWYRFEKEFEVVRKQYVCSIEELLADLNERGERVLFLGEGALVYEKSIQNLASFSYSFVPAQSSRQRAASVAALGLCYAKEGRLVDAAEHRPEYLRKPQAERERKEAAREVEIAPMQREDLAAVEGIEQQCFSKPWSRSLWDEVLESTCDLAWTARYRGEVIACCNLRIVADEAEIMRIAVLPQRRRMGAARKMMEEMLEAAKERQCERVCLEVREGNQGARTLYESYGFQTDGLREAYYKNPTEAAVLMSRLL